VAAVAAALVCLGRGLGFWIVLGIGWAGWQGVAEMSIRTQRVVTTARGWRLRGWRLRAWRWSWRGWRGSACRRRWGVWGLGGG
jgi:hypothetical protein